MQCMRRKQTYVAHDNLCSKSQTFKMGQMYCFSDLPTMIFRWSHLKKVYMTPRVYRNCNVNFNTNYALLAHMKHKHANEAQYYGCNLCVGKDGERLQLNAESNWLSHTASLRHCNKEHAYRRMMNLQPMAQEVFPVSERADLVRSKTFSFLDTTFSPLHTSEFVFSLLCEMQGIYVLYLYNVLNIKFCRQQMPAFSKME